MAEAMIHQHKVYQRKSSSVNKKNNLQDNSLGNIFLNLLKPIWQYSHYLVQQKFAKNT